VVDDSARADGRRRIVFRIDPGPAVKVRRVTVTGNERVSEERILKQMLTRPDSTFSRRVLVPETLREDIAAIRNLYRDQGFLQVEIAPPDVRLTTDGGHADILLDIREGQLFTISEVVVQDQPEVPASAVGRWTGLGPGDVFSPDRLLEAESALRAELDRRGYPDARVEAFGDPVDHEVRVRFEVFPGVRRRVGRIEISGNKLTKTKIIRRELALAEGDVISREKLLETQHRLYRLGIFRNVRIDYVPTGGDDPSLQTVRVRVEESKPFGLGFGLGYNTEAGVQVGLGLSHDNIAGYDRTITIQGRVSEIERRLLLTFDEPRLFTRRWPTLFSLLNETVERTGFTERRRSVSFRVERTLAPRWTSFVRYSFQNVDVFDITIPGEAEKAKVEDTVLGGLGYSLVWDARDDPFAPTRGHFSSWETGWYAPVLLSEESFVKTFAQYVYLMPVGFESTYVVSARLGLAGTFGDTEIVPLSERFFAGGDSTIRGFVRDGVRPFGGESLFILHN